MKTQVEKHTSPIYQELCEKIGAEKVKDDEAILVSYGFDSSIAPFRKPSLVVLPESRDDVKEVLLAANREKIPVTVMAGGVNVGGMCVPSEGGIVLDFRNMNRILEINTDSGYAVIEPGVIFDNFTSALSKRGFRCHVPTAPGGASPLGNYLLNPSGSLSNRHLDSILDLEVLLPDGTIVNTGSTAFPSPNLKPCRRYGPFPDLGGLFCCAYGTLGVVTKAAVRIYPRNESTQVNLAAFDEFGSAVKFAKDLINNNIGESHIIWSWQFYKTYDITVQTSANPYIPPELFNDARIAPKSVPYNIVTTFISGYTEITTITESVCTKVAEKYGGRVISTEEMAEISPGAVRAWQQFYMEYHQPKMEHNKKYGLGQYLALLIDATPQSTIEIEKLAMTEMADLGVKPLCYYCQPFDFGRYMMFRAFGFFDRQDKELLRTVAATFRKLYDTALERYGATPERYRPDPSMIQQLGGYYDLLKRIKKSVDPNNILNPGLRLFEEEEQK